MGRVFKGVSARARYAIKYERFLDDVYFHYIISVEQAMSLIHPCKVQPVVHL